MSNRGQQRKLHFKNAFAWRYPEAPMDLARALGEIAADLWLAGKLHLTTTPSVATFGTTDAEEPGRQVAHDQAQDLGS